VNILTIGHKIVIKKVYNYDLVFHFIILKRDLFSRGMTTFKCSFYVLPNM
jgi:hypothetical protein